VVLWDTARRERLQEKPLAVTEGGVSSVAFSPDGKTVAAGYSFAGGVGGVVLWDAARHERLQEKPLAVTEGFVSSVAFSPDGKTVAVGYYDVRVGGGGVVRFDIDLTSWRRQAGSIANRNLSWAEWQEYFPGQAYRKTFDWLPAAPGTEPTADVETPIAPATPSTRKD
jgi:WD40 repeat protein